MVTLVVIWSNNTPNLSDLSQVVTKIFQCTYSIQDCYSGKIPLKEVGGEIPFKLTDSALSTNEIKIVYVFGPKCLLNVNR